MQKKKRELLGAELKKLSASDIYPFHMPGHKRNMKDSVMSEAFDMDITEIDGFDDLGCPMGIIRRIEERAENYYNADRAFLSVNGSTCGILSAISALVPHRGRLLMVRNSHKSAYEAAYLGELDTLYLNPVFHEEYGLFGGADIEELERILQNKSGIDAVFITSPTYEGFISDVEKAADLVHSFNIPLIVDAAHGAHLPVSKKADISIVSLHKTFPALTSSALCLVNGSRIDINRLKFHINIFQTSSPSYLLMAGIDECFELLEKDGEKRKKELENNLDELYSLCEETGFIRLITKEGVLESGGFDLDRSKINIYDSSGRIPGRKIYELLLNEFRIQPEMSLGRFCLCMSSIMDTREGFERLKKAIECMDDYIRSGKFG